MGFGLAPAITNDTTSAKCAIFFLGRNGCISQGREKHCYSKKREATVSIDTPNVVEITIGYVRRYRGGGEFRSSLHCVDRVDVLPQRQNSDGGHDRIHSSRSDRTMLNCSRRWIGDDLQNEVHDDRQGEVHDGLSSGAGCWSLHELVQVVLSLERVWVDPWPCEQECHRMGQLQWELLPVWRV